MRTPVLSLSATLLLALGCAGGNYPPQADQMAEVQSANRTATELGAQKTPEAQLHLKLAEEQLGRAKAAMEEGDNDAAHRLLVRAKADAELAIALTREDKAKAAAASATDQSNAQDSTNQERSTSADQGVSQ